MRPGEAYQPDETSNGHSEILSASVMGKYVKTGTTGRAYDNVNAYSDERFIDGPLGGVQELWAPISEALKVPSNLFGANPHPLVL